MSVNEFGSSAPKSIDDAAEPANVLDQFDLWMRWPEPRLLNQTDIWIASDRFTMHLNKIHDDGLRDVLDVLRDTAQLWQVVAARDEQATLSSAEWWAYQVLDVRLIADMHPLVWMESTLLVRHIRKLLHQ